MRQRRLLREKPFSILNGCAGCHGEGGGGGAGPALTHISSQYPPAKLTALLKAPTAQMKAAGMVPLTLNAADMKALVSYVSSLGGTSAGSAATPRFSGSPTCAGETEPASRQPRTEGTQLAVRPAVQRRPGEKHFRFSRLQGMPRGGGAAAAGPALTEILSQYSSAKLTAVLKAPTAKMKAAGMVALNVNAADMKALVSYVTSLGGRSAAPVSSDPQPLKRNQPRQLSQPRTPPQRRQSHPEDPRLRQLRPSRQRQPKRRKRKLAVPQVGQTQPRGRAFTILKSAADATEKAGVEAPGQR